MLQGVITALVTPMHDNGEIDYTSLTNLIEFQIESNVNGLVVVGTTGEAAMLDVREKLAVIHYVIKQVNARVPIFVGVNDIGTKTALQTVEQLNKIAGIDYLLVVVPMYVKPTQAGIYQHFYQIANASTKPVVLYNVPSRTSSSIDYDTVWNLAIACPNIVGIKDATGDLNAYKDLNLLQKKPEGFALYSGDDITATEFILHGGNGVISVISNLMPKEFCVAINNAMCGNKNDALSQFSKMEELIQVMFIESNPIPLKWMLAREGVISSPYVRLPLTVLSPDSKIKIEQIFTKFRHG